MSRSQPWGCEITELLAYGIASAQPWEEARLEPKSCEGEWPRMDTAIWTCATSYHRRPCRPACLFSVQWKVTETEDGNDLIYIFISPLWLLWEEWTCGARSETGRPVRRGYCNTLQVRGDSGLHCDGGIWEGKKWTISDYGLETEPRRIWTTVYP